MFDAKKDLGWVRAAGTAHEIGLALGRAGKDAVHRHLVRSQVWDLVTGPAQAARVRTLAEAVRARFPAVWAELEGLAEGLELPLPQVVAWNCRGDLLASVPDGCTTVMIPGPSPLIGHNEDGLPFFRGASFIAEVAPADGPGFLSFCYPGSLPGHTFAVTDDGLVQTVNNLRLLDVRPAMPRMVIGRAVLGAGGLDEAVALLRDHGTGGGFHFALSHRRDRRILSVEFGAGAISVRPIVAPALHANHALHLDRGTAAQHVTCSSADRQVRGEALLAEGWAPLDILHDAGGPGLPIHRSGSDDPDDENTLATAVLHVTEDGVEWSIHDWRSPQPVYRGRTP